MPNDLDYLRGLLDRIERYGLDHRASWALSLRSGLSSDEIAALMEPTGLELPPEAEALFAWHDGVGANASPHARRLLPPFEFFPLQERVGWYLDDWLPRVAAIADSAAEAREDYWPTNCFPILDTGDRFNAAAVMVRCSPPGPAGATDMLWSRPVLLSGIESVHDAPRHNSLISLLEIWMGWLDDSSVVWDTEGDVWRVRDVTRHRHTWASAFG